MMTDTELTKQATRLFTQFISELPFCDDVTIADVKEFIKQQPEKAHGTEATAALFFFIMKRDIREAAAVKAQKK